MTRRQAELTAGVQGRAAATLPRVWGPTPQQEAPKGRRLHSGSNGEEARASAAEQGLREGPPGNLGPLPDPAAQRGEQGRQLAEARMTSAQMGLGAGRRIIRLSRGAILRAMATWQTPKDHLRRPTHALSGEAGAETSEHSSLMGASFAPSNALGQTLEHLLSIGM